MHHALVRVAAAIAHAHDAWLITLERRLSLTRRGALLEDRVARPETEAALHRNRSLRVPGRRRPHYRRHERMYILWRPARYRLSIERTAQVHVSRIRTSMPRSAHPTLYGFRRRRLRQRDGRELLRNARV